MSNGFLMMWNRPIPGREADCAELFETTLGYLGEQIDKGNIEAFEPCLMSAYGGQVNGFFLVRGKPDKLADVRQDKAFTDLVTRAAYMLEDYGTVPVYLGQSLGEVMGMWRKNF